MLPGRLLLLGLPDAFLTCLRGRICRRQAPTWALLHHRQPVRPSGFCRLGRQLPAGPPHGAGAFCRREILITHLQGMGLARRFAAYDIAPAAAEVRTRDTLADFPAGFDICITNPPWLAKNSATVRGLPFPETDYDDLYKLALALDYVSPIVSWVAALVPESFIRSGLFHHRLTDFISVRQRLFADTAHPAGWRCLARRHPATARFPALVRGTVFGELARLVGQLAASDFPPRGRDCV